MCIAAWGNDGLYLNRSDKIKELVPNLHCLKIIDKFIKKKLRDQEKVLLISAITQIVFLNFKEYAVKYCSVEIAKKLNLYPGIINATLKKIAIFFNVAFIIPGYRFSFFAISTEQYLTAYSLKFRKTIWVMALINRTFS